MNLSASVLLLMLSCALPLRAHALRESESVTFEIGLSGGLVLGGELTPPPFLRTPTNASVMFSADGSFRISRLRLGVYFLGAPMSGARLQPSGPIGTASGYLFSLGTIDGVAIFDQPAWRLEVGIRLGANFVGMTADAGNKGYDMTGLGLEVGPYLGGAIAVTDRLALTAQFGFLAQPVGKASVPARSAEPTFPFAPLVFLNLGLAFEVM